MKIVSNLQAVLCYQFSCTLNTYIFFLNSVATIGFNPATYIVAEGAGNVNITVSVLSGTLARGVSVVMATSLSDGTATGGILDC